MKQKQKESAYPVNRTAGGGPGENRQSTHSVLYLTTTGRVSGLPRKIEIWFAESEGRLYLLAEHFHNAQWVQNIQRNARVMVRIGEREWAARARVLDPERDREKWGLAQELFRQKYGWGDGLPVEIADFRLSIGDSPPRGRRL